MSSRHFQTLVAKTSTSHPCTVLLARACKHWCTVQSGLFQERRWWLEAGRRCEGGVGGISWVKKSNSFKFCQCFWFIRDFAHISKRINAERASANILPWRRPGPLSAQSAWEVCHSVPSSLSLCWSPQCLPAHHNTVTISPTLVATLTHLGSDNNKSSSQTLEDKQINWNWEMKKSLSHLHTHTVKSPTIFLVWWLVCFSSRSVKEIHYKDCNNGP